MSSQSLNWYCVNINANREAQSLKFINNCAMENGIEIIIFNPQNIKKKITSGPVSLLKKKKSLRGNKTSQLLEGYIFILIDSYYFERFFGQITKNNSLIINVHNVPTPQREIDNCYDRIIALNMAQENFNFAKEATQESYHKDYFDLKVGDFCKINSGLFEGKTGSIYYLDKKKDLAIISLKSSGESSKNINISFKEITPLRSIDK